MLCLLTCKKKGKEKQTSTAQDTSVSTYFSPRMRQFTWVCIDPSRRCTTHPIDVAICRAVTGQKLSQLVQGSFPTHRCQPSASARALSQRPISLGGRLTNFAQGRLEWHLSCVNFLARIKDAMKVRRGSSSGEGMSDELSGFTSSDLPSIGTLDVAEVLDMGNGCGLDASGLSAYLLSFVFTMRWSGSGPWAPRPAFSDSARAGIWDFMLWMYFSAHSKTPAVVRERPRTWTTKPRRSVMFSGPPQSEFLPTLAP